MEPENHLFENGHTSSKSGSMLVFQGVLFLTLEVIRYPVGVLVESRRLTSPKTRERFTS